MDPKVLPDVGAIVAAAISQLDRALQRIQSSGLPSQHTGKMLDDLPALTGHLRAYMRLFYGHLGSDLQNPERAALVMGPGFMTSQILQVRLLETSRTRSFSPAFLSAIWTEILRSALTARLLAAEQHLIPEDAAFTAAFAASWGGFLLAPTPEHQQVYLDELQGVPLEERLRREQSHFKQTHLAQAGAFCKSLNAPGNLIFLLGHHVRSTPDLPEGAKPLLAAIHWGRQLATALSSANPAAAVTTWVDRASPQFGLSRKGGRELVQKVLERTEEVAEAFGVSVPPQPSLAMLERGVDPSLPLGELSEDQLRTWVPALLQELRGCRRTLNLVEQELRERAINDPLTGLAGYTRFCDACADIAKRQGQSGEPLTAILLDVDRFGRINSQHGTAAGDGVLLCIRDLLTKIAKEAKVIARIGADRFALLLASDRKEGRLIAERIRAACAAAHVKSGRQSIRFTVSLSGVTRVMRTADEVNEAMGRLHETLLMPGDCPPNRMLWTSPQPQR